MVGVPVTTWRYIITYEVRGTVEAGSADRAKDAATLDAAQKIHDAPNVLEITDRDVYRTDV